MAEKSFAETAAALFQGMEKFVSSKTVVGETIQVGDAYVIPLVEVSCGMGTGSFGENAKSSSGGGMGTKITPSAVLVVQNGMTRLINIKNQNTVNKVLDMVPDIVNKISGGKVQLGGGVDEEALKKAQETADELAKGQTGETPPA
ncbi:MAG: GerW family sporulation protein [Lachnospiraceae bacterium]|jgi:uncharacterized spore protein YtfJ|nr:GerW family sporulation protein [Lachnospiraceae bacterium]